MRNSIQFPSQSLECCDISQRQLFPAFQTLLHPLAKLCGFIFHGTEKFGSQSIPAAEIGQKDNISDPFHTPMLLCLRRPFGSGFATNQPTCSFSNTTLFRSGRHNLKHNFTLALEPESEIYYSDNQ